MRTDGATNFASAYRHEILGSSNGLKCMHFCHIHLGGDRNTNLKESYNSMMDIRAVAQGAKGLAHDVA